MIVKGIRIPYFSEVIGFIERNNSDVVDRMNACEHAWETYMNLADLYVKGTPMHESMFRESFIAMGAMWGFRAMLK